MTWQTAFEQLEEGTAFRTRGRTITETDIVSFAALTGDWHPQHADSEWAARSQFGQRIAHGMLVVSFAVGLIPFDPDRVVALRRIRDVVFKRPVRIGDTIHVEGKLGSKRKVSEEAGLVAIEIAVVRQDGLRACGARIDALWRSDIAEETTPQAACGEMVWDLA